MRSKAERRHHRDRIKHRVENYNEVRWLKTYNKADFDLAVVSRTDTRKPCSCFMCCNARRNPWSKGEKLTMAERREFQKAKWECE